MISEDIINQDRIIFDLYRKLENTKTPSDQRELQKQIDQALDARLKIMKREKDNDLACC